MKIRLDAEIQIAADAESLFDLVNDPDAAPRIYAQHGPIPGVTALRYDGDGRPRLDAVRQVLTADGNVLEEQLVVFDRPRAHSYTLTGFKPPFSLLVRGGFAEWTFTEIPGAAATRVHWTYTFTLPTPLSWPLAALFLHTLFHGWMLGCLGRARREATVIAAAHA
jgi:hypothetical protein